MLFSPLTNVWSVPPFLNGRKVKSAFKVALGETMKQESKASVLIFRFIVMIPVLKTTTVNLQK